MLAISQTNNQIVLQWRGGSLSTQWVERAEHLGTGAVWSALFTNLPPTPATNTLAITNSPADVSGFYRVRVGR